MNANSSATADGNCSRVRTLIRATTKPTKNAWENKQTYKIRKVAINYFFFFINYFIFFKLILKKMIRLNHSMIKPSPVQIQKPKWLHLLLYILESIVERLTRESKSYF